MSAARTPAFLAMALLFAGCGDDEGGPPPAMDAAAADAGSAMARIVALGPCPAGWSSVVEGRVERCEPYPSGEPDACREDGAHFPGEAGCTRLGAECPADPFGDVPVSVNALYVSPGAAGGDGTRGAPFGTLAEAAVGASPPATLVLARGVHLGGADLPPRIDVLGACTLETVIQIDSAGEGLGVMNAALRNVRVVMGPGASAVTATSARVEDVVLEGQGLDLLSPGDDLAVSNVAIHDSALDGVFAMSAGNVDISRTVVRGSAQTAMMIGTTGTTTLHVQDVAASGFEAGVGLLAFEGSVVLERAVSGAGTVGGMQVAALAGTVDVSDVRVHDIESDENGLDGFGAGVQGVVSVARVQVDRVRDFGLLAYETAAARIDGLLVRDVAPEACEETSCTGESFGSGVVATDGGALDVTTFAVLGVALCGAQVDAPSSLDLHDGVVERSTIGACVASDTYDFARLSDSVEFRDNAMNLDATALPVPQIDAPPR